MPRHESLEYFPLFDVEVASEAPTSTAAIGDGVAALGSPDALGGAGAVVIYCYSKARNAWGYVGVITGSKAPGPDQVRAMGSSLVAFGNTVVVGAKGDPNTPGKVFVLKAPYGVWSYTTIPVISELTRPQSAKGDLFGASLASCPDGDGECIAVGAPGAAPPAGVAGPGQVFVFRGAGVSSAANPNPAGQEADGFGASIAVDIAADGTLRLAVGAPGAGQGAAYVGIAPSGGAIELGPAIVPAFPDAGEDFATTSFGRAVALSGDTLVVGAPDDPNFAAQIEGTGALWIYKDAGGTFEPVPERPAGPSAGAKFGTSLTFADPDHLVVGAPGASAAYVCRRDPATGGFVREEPLVRIAGKKADQLGASVAASSFQHGTWYLVVATGDAKAGVYSGGYLYTDADPVPTWMDIPELISTPPVRWGGLNQDWWKKFTPGIERYVGEYMAQPADVRERALAAAAEGL